jgi:hypothetical protein
MFSNALIYLTNPSDCRLGQYFHHLTADPTDVEIESMLKFFYSKSKEGKTNG